jgi:hypothetical protein
MARSYSSRTCRAWKTDPFKNPKTGRVIKLNGPTYKQLEKNCASPASRNSDCDKWSLDPEVNPVTNRKIKIGGPVYNALQKRCSPRRNPRRSPKSIELLQSVRPKEVTDMMRNVKYRANFDTVRKINGELQKECKDSVSDQKLLKLSDSAKNNFTDYEKVKKFQCGLVGVLKHVQKKEIANSEGIPVLDYIVKDYFKPIEKFGRQSANGTAYKVGWKGDKDWICVLKVAQGVAKQQADLFHELAVGLALNSLREKVPNFMYVWGGFYCDSPKMSLDCISTTPQKITTLALFEMVPGKELLELYEKLTSKQILEIIIQVCIALLSAQNKYKFVHYDLHGGNVIIRSHVKQIKVRVKTHEFSTSFVPQIIDYGMSSMQVDGKFVTSKFNDQNKQQKDVVHLQGDPNKYYVPLYDIWRYVSYIVSSIFDREGNSDKFRKLWQTLIDPFLELARDVDTDKRTAFGDFIRFPSGRKLGKTEVSRDVFLENIEFLQISTYKYLEKLLLSL